ncbi:hypothetical protein ACLBKT_16080 [Erythrobacter sp. W302b]|uniref:hypothetical protein n=1 Tax=Erythrobacter sp. W302b TaxID=3389874 RepID=UPI00396B1FF9
MHPSVNYDYVIHGDHIHWCNVEARGMTRCEELAMREHSTITADAAFADVALSMMIAMSITIISGLLWGAKLRRVRMAPSGAKTLFSGSVVEPV